MSKKKEKTVTLRKCTITLLGVIHGLEREGERVKYAVKRVKPECIAVGIPKEDVAILKQCVEGTSDQDVELETTPEQEYFFECLSSYGKVSIPPKDLLMAYTLSVNEGIALEAIDLDDEEYATAFTKNISLFGILKSTRKMRKLKKMKLTAQTPGELVEEWERLATPKSFHALEVLREKKMASQLYLLADNYTRILALIPYQRFEGVLHAITELKKHKNDAPLQKEDES